MANKITEIKERVLQIAKYHGVSYEKFSNEIGMSSAYLFEKCNTISPLVNLFTVFVFQPRVLADGGGIDPNPVF